MATMTDDARPLTADQQDGLACSRCGRPFDAGSLSFLSAVSPALGEEYVVEIDL